jgi:hypothetical protein
MDVDVSRRIAMPESDKKTIVKTIAATKARTRFGDILKRVHGGREQFIVEKMAGGGRHPRSPRL